MRTVLLTAVVLGTLAAPSAAAACTIAARPAEERVAEADAAVYGKVLSRRPSGRKDDGTRPGAEFRYRFRVLETYKGRVRRTITVLAHTDTGTCGAGLLRVGDTHGFLLHGRRGPWNVDVSSLITREELRSVRRPRRG